MKNPTIIYYSRTGTTRTVAAALAGALTADTVEVRCDRYGLGPFSYLRAGYDSVRGNLPPIELSHPVRADCDLIIIGAPIWTSYPALPIRAYLSRQPELPQRIGLFLTHGGHSPPQKAVAHVEALLKRKVDATLLLRSADIAQSRYTDSVATFVNELAG